LLARAPRLVGQAVLEVAVGIPLALPEEEFF
jgi:hypothetical protein